MRIELHFPLYLSELTDSKHCNDSLIKFVCTDSRLLQPTDLFIAIKGQTHDGSSFTEYAKSIAATVVSENQTADIRVDSINAFIARLISVYKSKMTALKKTVAITGSVGKTTTKDVLTKILSKEFKVHSTKGNQNNLLGTLFTLLSTPNDTELLILEFGMNHEGEISVLSKATHPDLAIITKIGTAHIGNLGSREMIAKAKLEIEDGMLGRPVLIPANEPLLRKARNGIPLSFDQKKTAAINFSCEFETESGYVYDFSYKDTHCKIKITQNDKRLAYAIGFSLATCKLLGANLDSIADIIPTLSNHEFRQKLIEKNGYKIYDDTYSSSYEAVLCVVDHLIDEYGEISCVLADMHELGVFSEQIHTRLGIELAKRNIKNLYLCGAYAESIAKGLQASSIHFYINQSTVTYETTLNQIKKSYNGEVLLIKGSHGTHTERLINLLIN